MDIKDAAIVTGMGIAKSNEDYSISIQILKPEGEQSGGSQSNPKTNSIVLGGAAKTMHSFVRNFIRDSKERLIFTHTRIWIVKDPLAKENLLQVLDFIERDEFPRLSSYLLITEDNPAEVLKTPPLSNSNSATELSLGMKSAVYASNYAANDIRETLRMLTEPPNTAYLPIVHIGKSADSPVLEIGGTAVIKNGRMIGKLNENETIGLLWLRNQVKGISISTKGASNYPVQVEAKELGTDMQIKLLNDSLTADLKIRLRGTIAEIPSQIKVNERLQDEINERVSATVADNVSAALKALQEKYHTDITGIGLEVYRKYPKKWHAMKSRWDEIFSHAKITVHVKTKIYHPGLINDTLGKPRTKPEINPLVPNTWRNE
jgi:Ger(x)C family germination protein